MSEKYSKEDLQYIAQDLAEELRDCEDGAKKSTCLLFKEAGYNTEEYDVYDLFDIHNALTEAADKIGITLDMSAYENQDVGLPFDLYYTVLNEEAKIKCPFCGNKDTARILYGSPAYNETLKRKMDEGKIFLGGCCITTVPFQGVTLQTDPARICNECKKKFGTPPVILSKKKNTCEDYRDTVKSIEFSAGGEYYLYTTLRITKEDKGASIDILSLQSGFADSDRQKTISTEKWNQILNRLYTKMYLHEWKKNYINENVLDGTQWYLKIELTGNRVRNYQGSNSYPAYWAELKEIFEEYTGRLMGC